ncbi:carbon-nitrogen family hydrolase [Peribacillus alkalitolerans]|uniref:carbon-nitrogen family hydrolase n=1 Tax=Peribacillus alkalitolerans TaxID=1550385 RepID=UPI0013D48CCA|nr:carbon-nitrogen family hydrolase [Peribacillus alkalitolerans]
MDIAFGDVQKNFSVAKEQIDQAANFGAEIILLPELWTTGYDLTRLDDIADRDAQNSIEFLADCAREHRVTILGGSVANQKKDGVYNTFLAIDFNGNVIKQYDKLHLFQLMDEHKFLKPGKTDGHFPLHDISCAAFICYDIRFPEWIRKHTANGAEVLFVSAEWPLPRLAHWRALLISRAIENQAFVIACNRSGQDPNNVFAGHSMVIDPWGNVIAEAGEEEELLLVDISIGETSAIRKQIPVFQDRKTEFYY